MAVQYIKIKDGDSFSNIQKYAFGYAMSTTPTSSFNELTTPGIYRLNNISTSITQNPWPSSNWYGTVFVIDQDGNKGDNISQIAFINGKPGYRYRCRWYNGSEYHWWDWESFDKLDAWPVGAVYISYVSTSPATLFGGTWTSITGCFPYFNASTSTGGSNTHTLTVNQIPHHSHTQAIQLNGTEMHWFTTGNAYSDGNYATFGTGGTVKAWVTDSQEFSTSAVGGGSSHNNMPAYQSFYAWRRTA